MRSAKTQNTVEPALVPAAASWDDLRAFVAVADAGSIGGGAARLGLNHSTVLRRIAGLEASLTVRLFDRLPGGYALTAAGNALHERLAGLAEQIEAAERSIAGGDAAIEGPIRVTTTDTLGAGLLMPLLARFAERHPRVQLQLVLGNSLASLTRREADVAVRGSNRPPGNLVGRRVGRIRTALYASSAFVRTHGRPATLDATPWVATDESLSHLAQAGWLRRHVPNARVAMTVDSLVGLVDAVRQGLGIGLLLCPLAEAHADLVRLQDALPELDTEIWILTHPDLRQVARVRAFTSFLFEAMSSDPRLSH